MAGIVFAKKYIHLCQRGFSQQNIWQRVLASHASGDGLRRHHHLLLCHPAGYSCTRPHLCPRQLSTAGDVTPAQSDVTSIKQLRNIYLQLAKARLTGLVMCTAGAGYILTAASVSPVTLASVVAGTALSSAAANTINQWRESKLDALMARTAARPLVLGKLSSAHALTYAGACATLGAALLYSAHPWAAVLAVANIGLYAGVYTSLKQRSIINTWVGSVVGAVPPLIGAAAAGSVGSLAGWHLALLLYAWQFPHFNALSWNLRRDYARAGYRMMAVSHPDLCLRVALRYTLLLTALPVMTSLYDVTSWYYAITATPVNLCLVALGWRFYRHADSQSARRLTRFSYVQLCCALLLVSLCALPLSAPNSSDGVTSVDYSALCLRRLVDAGLDLNKFVAFAERKDGASSSAELSSPATAATLD